jgi:hypothetical protein
MSKLESSLTPHQLQLILSGEVDDRYPALDMALSKDSYAPYSDSNHTQVCQQLKQYSLDHIIPSSRRGQDHLNNYFLMPRKVNNYFGNSWTAEKVAYIGHEAAQAAGRHHAGWYPMSLGDLRARRSQALQPVNIEVWLETFPYLWPKPPE